MPGLLERDTLAPLRVGTATSASRASSCAARSRRLEHELAAPLSPRPSRACRRYRDLGRLCALRASPVSTSSSGFATPLPSGSDGRVTLCASRTNWRPATASCWSRCWRRPPSTSGLRISRADVGEPGCGHWHSRPRLGPLGMLMGWWRVKVSSGCPLSGRLAAVERETGNGGQAAGALGRLPAGRADGARRHRDAGDRRDWREPDRDRGRGGACGPRRPRGLRCVSTSPASAPTPRCSPGPFSSSSPAGSSIWPA